MSTVSWPRPIRARPFASTSCSSGLRSRATAILIVVVLLDHQPASAALILGGFGLGVAFLKAEFSYTASWRRFLTRGEAGGLLGGLIVIAVCALAVVPVAALSLEIWRSHRAAWAVAGDRRLCLRHRHAARQRLRLRHALHGRRRLGTHAGRAAVFRRRQRIRQPVAAGVPGARRHRSRCWRRTISAPGAGWRRRSSVLPLAAALIIAVAQRARRQLHAVAKLHDRRVHHRPAVHCRVRRRRPSVERHLRLHRLGRQSCNALGFDLSHAAFWQWPGPSARWKLRTVRHVEPDRFRHAVRRHGGGRGHQALRRNRLAAGRNRFGRGDRRLC